MKAYSSGISRHTTRARFTCALNRRWSFVRWARSMTKMMSAHYQLSGARLLRIGRQPGGGGLHAGPVREHLLGRGRAQAVAGTEEEEVGQSGFLLLGRVFQRDVSKGLIFTAPRLLARDRCHDPVHLDFSPIDIL